MKISNKSGSLKLEAHYYSPDGISKETKKLSIWLVTRENALILIVDRAGFMLTTSKRGELFRKPLLEMNWRK